MSLLAQLPRRYNLDFFSVGQISLDTIVDHRGHHGPMPGGGALYPAVVATQLGLRSAVYGKVGQDFPSQALAKLGATGLNVDAVRKVQGEAARLTIDYLDEFEEKVSIVPGVSYELSSEEIPGGFFNSRVIHVSTLRGPFLRKFLERAGKQENTLVSFAPKSDLRQESAEDFAALLSKVDALFCNEFEIGLYSDSQSMELRLVEMAVKGPKLVVVTLGERGSLVLADQKVHQIKAFPIRSLISSCGAGDAYLAGFWCAYLRGWPLPECGAFASKVAVSVMRGYGLPLNTDVFSEILADRFCQEILAKPLKETIRQQGLKNQGASA